MDDRLIRSEIYNPNPYPIRFLLMPDMIEYILKSGIALGPPTVICPPDGFCILNHSFYVAFAQGHEIGQPINVVRKFGKDIGNGGKRPSIPVAD